MKLKTYEIERALIGIQQRAFRRYKPDKTLDEIVDVPGLSDTNFFFTSRTHLITIDPKRCFRLVCKIWQRYWTNVFKAELPATDQSCNGKWTKLQLVKQLLIVTE